MAGTNNPECPHSSARDLASQEDYPWGRALVELLDEGWLPVRECPMGTGKWYPDPNLTDNLKGRDNAYALILLEKK